MPPAMFREQEWAWNLRAWHMTALGKIGAVLLLSSAAGGVAANGATEYEAQPPSDAPITHTILRHTKSVLGKELVASGKNAGRIIDVLTDEAGRVRAVIVDYGGFLGVGSRKIAVAWSDLRFDPDSSKAEVTTDLPPDRLGAAPEVKTGKPVVVISGRDGE
jgi:hypothetical protein